MKVEEITRDVGRLGTSEETEFQIMNSPKAFKALSKNVYPDAVRAVIRELACNAKDAHVDAGKGDVPFEIHLPNQLEPWFAVTDFGIGLSHEDVMSLYRTYFDSTKTKSNDVTGQFGIGSKSPFAYVDSFTVEARWNGTMTLYSCFFNEKDIPTITVMGEPFPTDEVNGLTVKMPVKECDMREFAMKAASQLRRFDPAPTVTGNTNYGVKTIEYIVEGTGWKMLKSDNPYGDSKIHAIQGNVTYPVDTYALGELTSAQSAVMELSADIFFDIGKIDMVLSREALEYTSKTIENIKAALDVIIAELPPLYQTKFDDCKTLWDARILFKDVVNGLPNGLRNILADKDVGLKWHKQPLNERFTLDPEDFKETIIQFQRSHRSNRGSPLEATYGRGHSFEASNSILFFYDDVGHGSHSRITHHLESTGYSDFKHVYLIKTDVKKALKKYSKALGYVTLQPVSNLPKRPKEVRIAARVTSKVLEYTGKASDRRDSWKPTDLDLKTGGIYVMINRFKVFDGDVEVINFDGTMELVTANDIIDMTTTKVYGIRKSDLAKLPADSNWVELFDLIRTTIKDIVVKEKVASVLADYSAFRDFGFSLSNHVEELQAVGFTAGTPMAIFLEAYTYMDGRIDHRASAIASVAGRVSCIIEDAKPKHDLDWLWNKVTAQYPLIEMVDEQKMRGGYYTKKDEANKNFGHLMDYIAAMDLVSTDVEEDEAV